MLKEKLMKLLQAKKKSGSEMNPIEKDAKMSVLGDLKSLAEEAMGDKVKGLKKVSVAAPDNEGLKHGLEKAKELLGVEGSPEEEASESPEEEVNEDEVSEHEQSPEEALGEGQHEEDEDSINAKLQELQAKLAHMKAKKNQF